MFYSMTQSSPNDSSKEITEKSRIAQRKELEKQFFEGNIPYAMDIDVERFSNKNTIFSRVIWDPECSCYRKPITARADKKVGMKGYSRVGYAATFAAWTVHDEFVGAFDWERVGGNYNYASLPQSSKGGAMKLASDVVERLKGELGDLSSDLIKNLIAAADMPSPMSKLQNLLETHEMDLGPSMKTLPLPKYENTDLKHNSEILKRIGKIYGAAAVGICEIEAEKTLLYPDNFLGAEVTYPKELKYAIVMTIEMDYEGIKSSPLLPAGIATGNGYSRMAFAVACMAEFLRNLGYRAIPTGNDVGLSVPLAIKAGLGQFGRNGLLITPKYGQRVRICKVLTDFPLQVDKPINFGVTEFCKVCKKCAKYCPSQSISYEKNPTWEPNYRADTDPSYDYKSNHSGSFKWYVDVESCYNFWHTNSSDCSNCIRVCPFTKPPGVAHDIARFFIKHFRFLDWFMVKLDDLMSYFPWWNYGKKYSVEDFWKSSKWLGKK